MSKLIYAPSLALFKATYPDWAAPTSTIYRTLGYTEDGYMYTHGRVFQMSVSGEANPWGLATSISGQKLNVTVAGYTAVVDLPVVGIKTTTEDDLTVTSALGVYTVIHKEKFANNTTIGATAASNISIAVPQIEISKTGHVIRTAGYTATLNNVSQTADSTATTAYLLHGIGPGTAGTIYNAALKANFVTGALSATSFIENGVALAAKYAPIAHAIAATTHGVGNGTLYGHIKLSDAINSATGVTGGTAATPKAVLDSFNAAKVYAEELLGTTDAMLFVGTINGTGIIQTHNTIVIPSGVVDGTTNISALTNYSAGWTFKVTTVGTITSIGKVEPGDMIIANNNFITAYKAVDWSVIQANIDGAVSIASNLVLDTVILGATATTVKSLANGSNGQYLRINTAGKPVWTTVGVDMRAIKYNGSDFLTSIVNTALDLVAGSGISLAGNPTTGALTVTNTGVLDTYALTISNGATALGTYQPKTAVATIGFSGGLKAAVAGSVYTVSHTSSSTVKAMGLYETSIDAYGHVSAGVEVTALPNSAALTFTNAAGTAIDNYIGSVAKVLKIANGTDISFTMATASNIITVTPTLTHRYRPISFRGSGDTADTVVFANTNAGTLTLRAGSNVDIVNAAGVLTLSATDTNTWRNVKAILAGSAVVSEVLGTSIGLADLEFGSDFLWTEAGNNGKLQIGWAEIDASGNVTYVV